MRKMGKVLVSLAAMAAVVSLAMPVQAAPNPYDYTIRVFAGKQGAFSSGEMVEYTGSGAIQFNRASANGENSAGGSVTVNGETYEVTVPADGKYYAKGIRISGKDKILNSYSKINEDADYVIAYGVLSDRVDYTVRYLDTNGNELAPEGHYYGNAGDKPIVAFLNIDGYVPNAYNITKTLVKDEENIFTFTYARRAAGGGNTGGGGDTTVYDEEVVTTTNTTPVVVPGDGAGAAAGGGVTVVPGEGGAAGAGDAGGAGEAAAPGEPQELVDLDDEEVPLANVPGSSGGGSGIGSEPGSFFVNMPPAVIVGIVSMAVLAVAAAWFLIFKRKKKGTDEDEQE